jgi:hypothetical protein
MAIGRIPEPGTGIPESIIAAKGDLIVGTANDAPGILTVGTDGHTLVADSVETTGLKWVAPAGGSLDFQLLNTGGTNLTGATTITVSFAAQKALLIFVEDGSANASSTINIRFNADSGSNYTYSYIYRIAVSPATINLDYNTQSSFQFATQGSGAGDTFSGIMQVDGADKTGIKPVNYTSYATGTDNRGQTGNAFYKGTSAITSVRILSSSGNFDAGKIYVYGAA